MNKFWKSKLQLALIFFFAIAGIDAHADYFSRMQSDPLYKQVMSLCVPGHPERSLATLQTYFLSADLMGVVGGAENAVTFWRAPHFEKHVDALINSDPFFYSLNECFGNDEHGVFLSKALTIEIVLGYSASHAVVSTLLMNRVLSFAVTFLKTGAQDFLASSEWLRGFLDENPTALPLLRRFLPYLKWSFVSGLFVEGIEKGYQEGKEKQKQLVLEQAQARMQEQVQAHKLSEKLHALQNEYKSCSSEDQCTQLLDQIRDIERSP
jgi:hypothetical protein